MILLFASTASVEAFRSGTENLWRNIPSRSKIYKCNKVESLDKRSSRIPSVVLEVTLQNYILLHTLTERWLSVVVLRAYYNFWWNTLHDIISCIDQLKQLYELRICSIKSVSIATSWIEHLNLVLVLCRTVVNSNQKYQAKEPHLSLHLTNHNEHKMIKGWANQNAKQNHHHRHHHQNALIFQS